MLCEFFVLSMVMPTAAALMGPELGWSVFAMSLETWQSENSKAGVVPWSLLHNIGRFLNLEHNSVVQRYLILSLSLQDNDFCTICVSILGCWKRKRTKSSEIEFVLMMMRMKKREGSASWDRERNFNGMMKSGLHNLDIKWTCDLSYSMQLEVKHSSMCVLFSEQCWSSVVMVSLDVCGRLCCLSKPLLHLLNLTLLYIAKLSWFQAQANSETNAEEPLCWGQKRGTDLWERKELSWIAEILQTGLLVRPDLWLWKQLKLTGIAAPGSPGSGKEQSAGWRGEWRKIKWASILLSFSSYSVKNWGAAP